MDSVKSPAELKESLSVLYDILIDALDLIAEARAYLQNRDQTRYTTAAFLVRPDRPPERITVEVMRKLDDLREEAENDGLPTAETAEQG